MERSDDDEDSFSSDLSAADSNDEYPDYVERDPTGRYGRFDEVLGKGAYKIVYRAFDDVDGIEVAWNQVNICNALHNNRNIERLYSELHILKMLKHDNIMKFYNAWVDARCQNVNFITEIFTSGTLRQYRQKHKHVNLRAIKHWSRQILQGLVYLHSHNPPIIHRDLKCDNIFINGNSGEVKIGDLGLAVILSQAPAAHTVIGTPEFMAPELYEEHYNELVDIYSFGMCLLELITLEYPYSECINAAQIYRKVTMGKKPEALKKMMDLEMRRFVEKCLASASERLHAKELLMDQFLQMHEDQRVLNSCQSMILDLHDDLQDLYPLYEESKLQSATKSEDKRENVNVTEKQNLMKPVTTISDSGQLDFEVHHEKGSRDFRIKVKKQDDKKVLVRFRITSSAGVRDIQFDFELETDTAIDVANEMIAELDLIDQDPKIIAGMIEDELTALFPGWTPLSCEEVEDVRELETIQQELISESSDFKGSKANELEIRPPLEVAEGSSHLSESLVHGRFAELGVNTQKFFHMGQQLEAVESFSDFCSEQFEGVASDSSLGASCDRLSLETGSKDMQDFKNPEEDIAFRQNWPLPAVVSNLSIFGGGLLMHDLDGVNYPEEWKALVLQQKQEIEHLHFKHDQELLDLKTQLHKEA